MTELDEVDRDPDFDVVGLEHPGGILSLVAFRRMPVSQQQRSIRQLLGTFSEDDRPRVIDVTVPSLSDGVVRRIEAGFADRDGDVVVCPARRASAPACPEPGGSCR